MRGTCRHLSWSLHIRLLGQGGAADGTVWDLARQHGCLVVSKDEDFHRLRSSFGFGSATALQKTSHSSCDAVTTTSSTSTSSMKRQFSSWVEYNVNGRPTSACSRQRPVGS